ncbi:hypothetical protein ACJX0J_034998, partial [Zea mays]
VVPSCDLWAILVTYVMDYKKYQKIGKGQLLQKKIGFLSIKHKKQHQAAAAAALAHFQLCLIY